MNGAVLSLSYSVIVSKKFTNVTLEKKLKLFIILQKLQKVF